MSQIQILRTGYPHARKVIFPQESKRQESIIAAGLPFLQRYRLVQMRTRIMNQLQALAMNQDKRWKTKLWSEQGRVALEKLVLDPWASRRGKSC